MDLFDELIESCLQEPTEVDKFFKLYPHAYEWDRFFGLEENNSPGEYPEDATARVEEILLKILLVDGKLAARPIFGSIEMNEEDQPEYEPGFCKLGEYIPNSRKIILYRKNLDIYKDIESYYMKLYSTIVHELMHAYFDVPDNHAYIPEIEEALCEAGMLKFFSLRAKEEKFKTIFESVKNKLNSGCISLHPYGFGAYIYEQTKDDILTLAEAYHKIWAKTTNAKRTAEFIRNLDAYKEYKNILYKKDISNADLAKCLEFLKSIIKQALIEVDVYK